MVLDGSRRGDRRPPVPPTFRRMCIFRGPGAQPGPRPFAWRGASRPAALPHPATRMTTSLTSARPALTTFSDEELMFRDAVAAFAEEEVRPRVQAMEQAGK